MRRVSALVALDLRERRAFLVAFTLATVAVVLPIALLYPSIGQTYADVTDELPEGFLQLVGDADLGTAEGFLQVELGSIVAPFLVLGLAVSVAARALAGLEQRHLLTLILATPVGRWRVVASAYAAMVVVTLGICLAILVSLLVGSAIADLGIPMERLGAFSVDLALLGLAFGSIALAVGALTGRRGLATSLAGGLAVASYLVYTLTPLTSGLESLRYVSLWYPYADHAALSDGADMGHAAILAAVSLASVPLALWGFMRRDIAG